MNQVSYSVAISFAFLAANVAILLIVLGLNRRAGAKPGPEPPPTPGGERLDLLDPSNILEWEFVYARTTASEAMQDRHTMVNFYLLVVGVVASGVIAALGQSVSLSKAVGGMLLWLLCGIGWLYFLQIIRLRQAWHDSARTMNRIKEFYFDYAKGFARETLRSAFRWQAHTLPAPDKPWTLYFYSALLIGFLDSMAYAAGGALIDLHATPPLIPLESGLLVTFGLALFAFHIWLYFAFLKPEPASAPAHDVQDG